MELFQMKTRPCGIERVRQFIEEKFVCIGWPGIGNLAGVGKDEIRDRLEKKYESSGHKLGNMLGQVNTFVNTMKSGDVILINERDWVNIGIVGDYEYISNFDNEEDGMCHQRSVRWINRVPINQLDSGVQRLLSNRNTICQYPDPIETAGLEIYFGKQPIICKNDDPKLDELFQIALGVLEEELKSEDPDRRLKAAAELLRFKTST